MRNTRISAPEPVFLTGGPRLGPTTTYFWDHTEWSRLYALLEPAGLRSWLLRALSSPYDRSFGFDTRNGGPLGNHYAANDYALFRLVEHYICVTGDVAFLSAEAGARTVLGHLERLAYGWKARRTAATGGVLADFGADPWTLLECVPNYVNVVASFNAAYAGMTRSLAGLLRMLGRTEAAAAAEAAADTLARAVIGLSLPDGRWQIRHPGSTESIGHCLDFGLVAAHLHADLTKAQRSEAVQFVSGKLLASTWMRALALDDPVAPVSNRPDHGAAGAFCAWPGVTAHGLAKLGRKDLAARLLSVVHESASGGLWGQAMEIVTDSRGEWVRVAEDGVSNRDSIAGVATAEAVVSGLFGFEPTFRCDPLAGLTCQDSIEMPGIGRLSNINIGLTRPTRISTHRVMKGAPVSQSEPRVVALDCFDVRFPTSLEQHGSDAMNPDPDYSAAYVILRTDSAADGHALCFTIGRGNEVVVAAIEALRPHVVDRRVGDIVGDLGGFSAGLIGDSQLRWLGPEKGVMHMAIGAVVNAAWDLAAKRAGQPLWQLLAEMTPEQTVALVDFRYLEDALSPDEALGILRAAWPSRGERIAELLRCGYPAYTTTPGWIGYSDEKLTRAVQAGRRRRGFTQIKLKVGGNVDADAHAAGTGQAGCRPGGAHRRGREPALECRAERSRRSTRWRPTTRTGSRSRPARTRSSASPRSGRRSRRSRLPPVSTLPTGSSSSSSCRPARWTSCSSTPAG